MALPVRILEHRPAALRWMPQAEPVVSAPASQATADLRRLSRRHPHGLVGQMVPTPRTRRAIDADGSPGSATGSDAGTDPAANASAVQPEGEACREAPNRGGPSRRRAGSAVNLG